MRVEPGFQDIEIETVGVEPVDRGEVAGIGQRAVQAPKDLGDAHGGLGDRLRGVAAGRRDRTDGRQAAVPLVAAQALHTPGALVELGQAGGQIGGVALLARHLLQPAGHLAQRLGPTGGGVGDDGHIIAHVAEVLRNGDAGVNGRLTGGHGHVGGVGDEHGTLHDGVAGPGIDQLWKLI